MTPIGDWCQLHLVFCLSRFGIYTSLIVYSQDRMVVVFWGGMGSTQPLPETTSPVGSNTHRLAINRTIPAPSTTNGIITIKGRRSRSKITSPAQSDSRSQSRILPIMLLGSRISGQPGLRIPTTSSRYS
jgi:hypothetical protein